MCVNTDNPHNDLPRYYSNPYFTKKDNKTQKGK